MKDKLKNPKVTAAIVVIAVVVFGAVVVALGGNDNNKTADNTKNDSSQESKNKDDKDDNKDESKVESATTTTPSGDVDATDVYTGYTGPSRATVAAATTTTPATTPATPAQTPTPPVVPPVDVPETPPIDPEVPPTEEPEPVCEVNGRVVVQVGGISCSYTIGTADGSVAQWELPWARTHSDDGTTVNDTETPVYVVIESQSQAGDDEPWTASSITYHYRATETAPAGDFDDAGGDLTFYTYNQEGELDQDFSQPVTVTEPVVTP